MDTLEIVVEQIAYDGGRTAQFFRYEADAVRLLDVDEGFVPAFCRQFEFGVEFGHATIFGHGAHDESAVGRFDALHQLS